MPKTDLQKLGQAIKQLREKSGLSQETLAQALHIPRPSVTQLEKGARDLSVSELNTLLTLFSLSYPEFMSLHEEPTNPKKTPKKTKVKFDPEKFKQLLLYILQKCGSKPNVGETVLYKLLYFCDFDYFELHEKPLTGMAYKRLQYGPVPDQSAYLPLINQMTEKGQLQKITRPYIGSTLQTKYIAFQEADLNYFDSTQIAVIDKVINRLSDMSARQIEAHVHHDYPWKSHQEGDIIDYASVFSREGEFAQRDYDSEFLQASANDAFGSLPPLSQEEYDYYISLPEIQEK